MCLLINTFFSLLIKTLVNVPMSYGFELYFKTTGLNNILVRYTYKWDTDTC